MSDTQILADEQRWQRARDALRLVCAHARLTRFVDHHVNRNALPQHRLFLVAPDSAAGARVIDERARREWRLPPGSATVLPARRTYRFEFVAGFRLVGFHFRLEGVGGVDVLDGALAIAQTFANTADAAAACAAVELRTPGDWLVLEGLLRLHLGRCAAVRWDEVERAAAAARRWSPTIAQLDDAAPGAASIAGLARNAGLSRQHFTRRFRADFGCTPRAWHQRQLARRAVDRLLADDAPLDAIADEFGFSDAFALSRFVLRATGMRPTRWRSQAAAGAALPA